MTHQEAIEKAVKLLRLAQSSNQHEAALAASRAQEIMDRHKLEGLSADYDTDKPKQPDEPIADFKADLMDPSTQNATWKSRLAATVAKVNECKVYIRKQRTYAPNGKATLTSGFAIVGRASDAQTVRYIYGWLSGEIDRLAHAQCAGYGATFYNNFRIGAVESVCARLEAARKETEQAMRQEAMVSPNAMAMVHIKNAIACRDEQARAVERWVDNNLKLRNVSSSYRPDFTARQLGQKAGAQINIKPRQMVTT